VSIHFKIAETATKAVRDKVLAAVAAAGFKAAPLFGNLKRAALASIYTIPGVGDDDLPDVRAALRPFAKAIDYVEAAPERFTKR
jgi:hypothetical protein